MASTRVALVTGAARGIGRQVALTLADLGYAVATNDLEVPEVTLKELGRAGARSLSVPGDVSDEASVRGMDEAVMGETATGMAEQCCGLKVKVGSLSRALK